MKTFNPLFTSFFGEWALAAGLDRPAKKAGDSIVRMVDLNKPHMRDSGRFYYNYDYKAGKLATECGPGDCLNTFIDVVGTKQHFYHIGTAMAFLADLYKATQESRYLEAAEELADFERRLNPVGLRWPSYCKIGWGAGELYGATGKPEHRIAAANVSHITFMAAQKASGGWSHMFYPVRGDGIWRTVEYDGTERVPTRLPEDGSWALLSGIEITGEFLGEMGRTLKNFKAMHGRICRRLEALGLPTEK